MLRKLTLRVMLLCYGTVALAGQGLHLLVHEHERDGDEHAPVVAAADPLQQPAASHSHDDDHDCDHCAVCQYHSLGQLFVAAPPTEIVLGLCQLLNTAAPQRIRQPAIYSPAQPRAPPIA